MLAQEWALQAPAAGALLQLLHGVGFVSLIKNNLVYNLCFMIQLCCSQQLITIRAGSITFQEEGAMGRGSSGMLPAKGSLAEEMRVH